MIDERRASAARLGFGPERRLRKRAEFTRVQDGSRRVTTAHYVLLVAPQPPPPPPTSAADEARARTERRPARLGLIVTRKVGGAVARNRIKRVCRECFRAWPDLLPPGIDLVVVARAGAQSLGLDEVRAEWGAVSRLLRRRAEEALAHGRAMPHVSGRPKPRSPELP